MTDIERQRDTDDLTPSQAASQGLSTSDPRDPNRDVRPARVPMQDGLNLDVSGTELDWDNYHYRFFTDNPKRPGRIQNALAAYWEHVPSATGGNTKRPNGNGSHTYLMRLPRQYWDEDLKRKKAKVARTLGEQTRLGKNEYAPTSTHAEGGSSSMVQQEESDNPYS